MGKSCELVASITEGPFKGEPSELHAELLNMTSRPIANYIYASYLGNGVAERMESETNFMGRRKYLKGKNGEFKAKDVIEYLGLGGVIQHTVKGGTIGKYNTAQDALKVANDFNSTTSDPNLIAEVIYQENEEHKEEFVVKTFVKDSLNILRVRDTKYHQLLWDKSLDSFGVSFLDSNLFSREAINVEDTLKSIIRLQYKNVQNLNEDQLKFLAPQIDPTLYQRLENSTIKGGTVADKLYRILNEPSSIGPELLNTIINELKDSINAVVEKSQNILDQAEEEANIFERSNGFRDSATVKKLLELNEAFDINTFTFVKNSKKINSVKDAYIEAALNIERKLREIDLSDEDSINDLSDTKSILLEELQANRHTQGLLDYLSQGITEVTTIIEELKNLQENITTEDSLEYIFKASETLKKAIDFVYGFKSIAEYLSVVDAMNDLDVSLTLKGKKDLAEISSQLLKNIIKLEQTIDAKNEVFLKNLCITFLGGAAYNSLSEVNVAKLLSQQGSFMSRFFKPENSGNSVISSTQALIREQQDKRDEELNKIIKRIGAADYILKQAGHTNDFMIDRETGYIKSNINWSEYNKEKGIAIGRLKAAGYSGLDFRMRLKQWEYRNTEEIVVDTKSGRTERLPSQKYRTLTEFRSGWSKEQNEYYDTIMQIKGELGTMLPDEARQHYLPPQVRLNNVSTMDSAMKGKISSKDAFSIIWDRIAHPFKIREDDRDHAKNGIIIDGETYALSFSNFDSTELKNVPIFYINKLKNQNELEDNFSRSLTHLASTSVNYKYMIQIKDTVEYISDLFSKVTPAEESKADTTWQKIGNLAVKAVSYVTSRDTTNADMVNTILERQIYGISSKWADKWASRVLKKLTSLNSIRALAVNVKGAASNVVQGEYQMMIEALSKGEFFSLEDYMWAKTKVFGDDVSGVPSALMDLTYGIRQNKAQLFEDMFNPQQEQYSNLTNRRFYNSPIRQIFGSMDSIPLYSVGERMMAREIMYAVLHKQKVLIKEGNEFKTISLYDAFAVKDSKDGVNKELVVKDNVHQLNGEKVNDDFLRDIKKKIRSIKQNLLGAMNSEDKGIVHHNDIWRAAMSFRQWMVGYFERRFRGEWVAGDIGALNQTDFFYTYKVVLNDKVIPLIDAITYEENTDGSVSLKIKDGTIDYKRNQPLMYEDFLKLQQEAHKEQITRSGYWTDFFHIIKNMIRDSVKNHLSIAAQWHTLSNRQKANVRRTLSEMSMFMSLVLLLNLLGINDDDEVDFDDYNWIERFLIYQARRTKHDAMFGIPIGVPVEMLRIVSSPFPQYGTIEDLYYPVSGLMQGHHKEKLQSGPDRGRNKYWRNIEKEVLKIPYDIKEFIRMDEDELNVFNRSGGY